LRRMGRPKEPTGKRKEDFLCGWGAKTCLRKSRSGKTRRFSVKTAIPQKSENIKKGVKKGTPTGTGRKRMAQATSGWEGWKMGETDKKIKTRARPLSSETQEGESYSGWGHAGGGAGFGYVPIVSRNGGQVEISLNWRTQRETTEDQKGYNYPLKVGTANYL